MSQLPVQIFDAVAHDGDLALSVFVDHAAVGQAGHLGGEAQADQVAVLVLGGEVNQCCGRAGVGAER